jgi:endonuclease/exonuclease/phosphatase family metal-dependent hydrolase
VFSTGDWNSTVTAESLGPMMQSELMKDAMLTSAGGADNVTNSGHTIGKIPGQAGNIIDHVFISADATEALYHDVVVNDTVINGSDHCPVYTDVKFK